MSAQLKQVPTLHDLAIKSGAFMDKADPAIGIPCDSYVFTREELVRFVEINVRMLEVRV